MFEGKSIYDITETDLQGLIGISREHQNVDFKSDAYQLPPSITDQSKRDTITRNKRIDLCTDISAFANGTGGWIICGMKEKGGIATELMGLGSINGDAEELRLREVAQASIEPYPHATRFRAIPLHDTLKGFALIIQIPRSYNAPHRVKETGKFHVRRSNGNSEMTIDELRTQFTLSAMVNERVKAFRKERVDVISTPNHEDIPVALKHSVNLGDTNQTIERTVKLILHVIPFSAFGLGTSIDLSVFSRFNAARWVSTHNLTDGRFNLDGYVRTSTIEQPSVEIEDYIQVFRNGIVECVEILPTSKPPRNFKELSLTSIERAVINNFNKALVIQKTLCQPPLVILLSITNIKNRVFVTGMIDGFAERENPFIPITRNHMLIPDVFVENLEQDSTVMVKPVLDLLWNAAGFEGSLSYDENGKWRKR